MANTRKHNWIKLFQRIGYDTFQFTLVAGVDYTCRDKNIAQQIRNHASSRGLSVSVEIGNDQVTATVRPVPR